MIELRTLGHLDLSDAAGRELKPVLLAPKRVALLTYLAVATPRGWPGTCGARPTEPQ